MAENIEEEVTDRVNPFSFQVFVKKKPSDGEEQQDKKGKKKKDKGASVSNDFIDIFSGDLPLSVERGRKSQKQKDSPSAADDESKTQPAAVQNQPPTSKDVPRAEPVLLKTAVAPISVNTDILNATILFDEGATQSFVTRETAEKLNMKPVASEMIQLAMFGDTDSNVRSFDVGTFQIQTLISALTVPEICAPLLNLITHSLVNLPHLRGLKLAHPVPKADSFQISVLIGADYYWDFIEDHVIRGPGPTAVWSKFGYLLLGPSGKKSSNINTTILHIATTT
uniref:Uncharacterized protein LOC102809068 n=1 Tax=Saccoglossus kowalevskii TaxID=10224 RepID=A0ABM0MS57_SACKO|nr:PREDICTED: uncharacterized protein LOC102809068 [Saccoglossus kowalevskii]